MHVITDPASLARVLDSPLPPAVRRLLRLRAPLLGNASFVVVEPGTDSVTDVEAAAGLPIATNMVDGSRYGEPDFTPSAEWVLDHGGAFELTYVTSDDGPATVVILPDDDQVDPTLLAIARGCAEPAAAIGTHQHDRGQPAVR